MIATENRSNTRWKYGQSGYNLCYTVCMETKDTAECKLKQTCTEVKLVVCVLRFFYRRYEWLTWAMLFEEIGHLIIGGQRTDGQLAYLHI